MNGMDFYRVMNATVSERFQENSNNILAPVSRRVFFRLLEKLMDLSNVVG